MDWLNCGICTAYNDICFIIVLFLLFDAYEYSSSLLLFVLLLLLLLAVVAVVPVAAVGVTLFVTTGATIFLAGGW